MANANLEVFKKLCDKAQEIIFDELESVDGFEFFKVCYLDEDLLKMTPIEQIFYIMGYITADEIKTPLFNIFEPQKKITIKDKTYYADFYVDKFDIFTKNGIKTVELDRPIVIELDGYDYHKTKNQLSHDYERENDLKFNGYDVLRFTGTQVYNNARECIRKIYDYIFKMLKNQRSKNNDGNKSTQN